ncbi:MAG: Sir2 family NAD-dependent protein deacetylase [Nitrospinae bacterium]|nr:Sir2 family NAD-dependent protein deacetylase [Nitrospinota bacterium]
MKSVVDLNKCFFASDNFLIPTIHHLLFAHALFLRTIHQLTAEFHISLLLLLLFISTRGRRLGDFQEKLIEQAAAWVVESHSTVCLTGAGISTESGIPDFRSKGGIWDRFDPKDFEIRRWLASEDIRRRYWEVAQDGYNLVRNAPPSSGHFALARLSRHDHLKLLVTQNTDGLHQKAGHDPEKVVELHGTSHVCVCVGCGAKLPRPEVHARVQGGEAIPKCEDCGSLLKPDAVFFGEGLSPEKLSRAVEASKAAEVFLVAGSSLAVRPAGGLPERARKAGARLIIVNEGPTRFDAKADIRIQGKTGNVLPALVNAVLA